MNGEKTSWSTAVALALLENVCWMVLKPVVEAGKERLTQIVVFGLNSVLKGNNMPT